MKKLYSILLIVLIISLSCLAGCKTVFDGEYKVNDSTKTIVLAYQLEKVSAENSELTYNVSADLMGTKTTINIATKYVSGDLKLKGSMKTRGARADYYYFDGQLYTDGILDGSAYKIKEKMNVDQVIFGQVAKDIVGDLTSTSELLDVAETVSYYATKEGASFYLDDTGEFTKIKVVLKEFDEIEQLKFTKERTTTTVFVFDKDNRFVCSRVNFISKSVSKGDVSIWTSQMTVERKKTNFTIPSLETFKDYINVN